jgi:hypothetical protein
MRGVHIDVPCVHGLGTVPAGKINNTVIRARGGRQEKKKQAVLQHSSRCGLKKDVHGARVMMRLVARGGRGAPWGEYARIISAGGA